MTEDGSIYVNGQNRADMFGETGAHFYDMFYQIDSKFWHLDEGEKAVDLASGIKMWAIVTDTGKLRVAGENISRYLNESNRKEIASGDNSDVYEVTLPDDFLARAVWFHLHEKNLYVTCEHKNGSKKTFVIG